MQTCLNQGKVLFVKTTNMIQSPKVYQHQHMIFISIGKKINVDILQLNRYYSNS